MLHTYKDITNRLGPPKWWDEAGVPRYCNFSPQLTNNIYATEVAYLEIACQRWAWRFTVVLSWGAMSEVHDIPRLSQQIVSGIVDYGDPPNTECCLSGPTMNSIPLIVVEFWRRNTDNRLEFERISDYEIDVSPDWAKD